MNPLDAASEWEAEHQARPKHPTYPLRDEESRALAMLIARNATPSEIERCRWSWRARRDFEFPGWREQYEAEFAQWLKHTS